MTVLSNSATVTGLQCGSATFSGTNPTLGNNASGILTVPYTGGNGASYTGYTINSGGVTGLTLTLSNGTLANNTNGSISLTLGGRPNNSGAATFTISLGGRTCTYTFTIAAVTLPFSLSSNEGCSTNAAYALTNKVIGSFVAQSTSAGFTQSGSVRGTYTSNCVGGVKHSLGAQITIEYRDTVTGTTFFGTTNNINGSNSVENCNSKDQTWTGSFVTSSVNRPMVVGRTYQIILNGNVGGSGFDGGTGDTYQFCMPNWSANLQVIFE